MDHRAGSRTHDTTNQVAKGDDDQDRLPAAVAAEEATTEASAQQAPCAGTHQMRLISTVVVERCPMRRPTR